MSRSEIAVGLMWHSANSGNLGVGALTIANMAIAREAANDLGLRPRFTIIGMRDTGEPYVSADEAERFDVDMRSTLDPRGAWAAIQAQDCILDIGSGDSFTDIYTLRRYALMWGTKAIAILSKRPLLLSPQTIGPFGDGPLSVMAGWAMRRSEVVVARDRPSMEATARMAPAARTVLATDVAFTMPYEDRSHERAGPVPRVAINVSGLLYREAQRDNRFALEADYAAVNRSLIERFLELGVQVELFTHAVGDSVDDDDGWVADRLAAEYPGVKRIPDFRDPRHAKSYLSGVDFVVSGRMHACIGALSSGTPVVPIAYSRKFAGVFDLVEYPWRVEVTGRSADAAVDYILDCYDRRHELAAAGRRSMTKVNGLLDDYRVELRNLFTRVTQEPQKALAA